ncbi:MAG TPA: M6 family metalloprotease domain-containing protein [Candidatus Krumholzibacteria bacterium]|nr:M6 family metalloprotease domain-containing protein [Candidatus Krumholzibacteria bacterium]HPD71209.1 M6 family metalloprotease domain-containing protein [Candidatus Krumholzibacteria bacterium]HRY39091.1 M6 family metalloprotease domain-containing protein [Candidatus Krumholzibacteria bacterium]
MTVARSLRPILTLAACGLVLAAPSAVLAVPVFGELTSLRQPDGSALAARVWGDEYHQRLEDLAGYTLTTDPATGWICYARLDPGGAELVSTGVRAGEPVPADLRPGVKLPAEVVAARVAAARAAAGLVPPDGDKIDYPLPAVTGAVRGIALLVDFSDERGVLTPGEVEAFLNQIGYGENGNNGSVRDYFRDVSGGRLDLTHEVTPYYYRAAHPKSWYEDPGFSPGWRARLLVTEALEELERHGCDFGEYDANGDGYVDLVSCFYAGAPRWSWGVGLWPQAGEAGFHADGVIARLWQITAMRDELTLGTPCHEIGHALCQWADLYDTGGESWGVGLFCLMSNPSTYRNPLQPCGPLKFRSGWTEDVLLDGVMPRVQAPATGNRVFVVPHPAVDNELYLVENRRRAGRDADLPDEGLAVWHVDWRGDNNLEVMSPDLHYMVTLVQADGRWDLEHDANWGDATDLFGAPEFTHFGPDSDPAATWWRGQPVALYLDNVSAAGDTVIFDFRDGIGIYPLQITVEPDALGAPWLIVGADGYLKSGEGSRLVHVPVVGSYLITWRDVPGWQAPPSSTVIVPPSGPIPEVRGTYTHPPFMTAEVPILASAVSGRGGQLVDFDADGDLDIYLCREGSSDQLVRNDGGWEFTEVTPPALAGETSSLSVAWADVDADGDQDCFVVRRDLPALLLRQQAPGVFAGAAELAPAGLDAIRGAVWLDYDGDRRLDLHLVRDGKPDLLLRAPGRDAPLFGEYEVQDILPGLSFARTVAGAWCDYDADGRPDLYQVNLYGENVLVQNRLPARFVDVTHGGLGTPWRGGTVAWGDFDGDADFDLYVVQDGAADVVLRQYNGVFVLESGENTDTPGQGRDAVWADFDNDGDLDLYVTRFAETDRLLMNDGEGHWVESPILLPEVAGPNVAALAGDLDGDGGIDLVIDCDGAPTAMLRNTMDRGHWLQVNPVARGTLREPTLAVLRAHVGDRVMLRQVPARSGPSREPTRVHFGLGEATQVDSLVVTWPNRAVQTLRSVAADQILAVVQPLEGGTGTDEVPAVTALRPVWPNPFNPGTNISFDLAVAGPVRLAVFDVSGRRIATIHDGSLGAGTHAYAWDGNDSRGRPAAAGVYLLQLVADGSTQCRRMALIR